MAKEGKKRKLSRSVASIHDDVKVTMAAEAKQTSAERDCSKSAHIVRVADDSYKSDVKADFK